MARTPLPLETWGTIRRTVTKAGSPAAIAYYRDIDGVRRRILRTGPTPAQAEDLLKIALRDRLAPSQDYLTPTSTLTELAKTWVEDLERSNKSPGTTRRYKSVVRTHVNEHVGGMRISEVTVPRLQRIIDLAAENSEAQARMFGIVLTGMLDLAVRHGALKDNPSHALRLPTQERKEVRAPSIEELKTVRTLLAEYDKKPAWRGDVIRDLGDFADMMLATGARIGEVLALQWDDFNLEEWTVTIQSTLVSKPGEGLVRKAPKTRSSVRTLVLPEFVRPMVSTRFENSVVAWVFPSANLTARWPENIRQQWRDALKGHDVAWVGPHDLRKAVATALGTEGAKDQLGHASTVVTDKHYVEKVTRRPDQSETLSRFGNLAP